jgi:WD40 repeat protein
LASGGSEGVVEVREIPTDRTVLRTNLHSAPVRALAWSPDGRRIASAGRDQTVCIWDPQRGEELLRFETHNADIRQLEWSPNGSRLAASAAGGEIFTWSASSGYQVAQSEEFFGALVSHQLGQAAQLAGADQVSQSIALYSDILDQCRSRSGPEGRHTIWAMHELAAAHYDADQEPQARALCVLHWPVSWPFEPSRPHPTAEMKLRSF